MKKLYPKEVLIHSLFSASIKWGILPVLLLLALNAHAQIIQKGVVHDEKGVTLPGVSVIIKGSKQGTTTDNDGRFNINVPAGAVLIFKYVGFNELETPVNASNTALNIGLKPTTNNLTDVIVVGYGTQKKSDVTGAIASFKAKDLETMPQVNIQQALQGKVAGLSASTIGASAEGGNQSLQIRGRNSITAANNPLVILDGVIFDSSLSEINPEDIASVEILKDASSAAIYGSRAANGVILVTTKKGKTGKAQIGYNNYFGFDKAINIPDMMSGQRFYDVKLARFGAGTITATERNSIANGISTDWVGLALRNGNRQEHNVSISGGSDDTHYFISGTVNPNHGVSKNDNFSRYNIRFNVDSKIGSLVTFGTNTQLGYYDRSGQPANFSQAFLMNPLTLPYNADGSLNLTPWPDDAFWNNPLEGLNVLNSDITRSIFTNNYVKIDIPFVKGLSYKLNTGYNYRNQATETYYGRNTRTGLQNKGRSDIGNNNTDDWLVENLINYDRSSGKHTVSFTGLYSRQQRKYISHSTSAIGFVSDIQTNFQNGLATTINATDNYDQYNNVSQMARLNYSFNSKYLLTATVRRDGYSGFGSNTKYGVFPSIALGWNISNEDFIKKYNWIENLKLRASYGKNGNQAIGAYATLPQMSNQNYLNNDKTPAIGYYTNKLGDPSLGWESTRGANLGLDFAFLKGRIAGSIDYYNSKTSDLLLSRSISPVNGVKSITQNIGSIKNQGIDFTVSTFNMKRGNFTWTTDFNISHNSNKILNVGLTDANGAPISDIGNTWFIGKPISVNYSYQFDGIWQATDNIAASAQPTAKPGDVKIKDVNGDGKITTDDRTVIGSRVPNYIAGLTNTFSYKGFSLSVFIRAVHGITKTNSLLNTYFDGRNGALDRQFWTPDNPINTYPANRDDANPFGVGIFDRKTSDASFIRLQDVSLSYTLPKSIVEKLRMRKLQVFANAKNLATSTNWIGLDPEFDSQTGMPQVRTFIIGLRTQF